MILGFTCTSLLGVRMFFTANEMMLSYAIGVIFFLLAAHQLPRLYQNGRYIIRSYPWSSRWACAVLGHWEAISFRVGVKYQKSVEPCLIGLRGLISIVFAASLFQNQIDYADLCRYIYAR